MIFILPEIDSRCLVKRKWQEKINRKGENERDKLNEWEREQMRENKQNKEVVRKNINRENETANEGT